MKRTKAYVPRGVIPAALTVFRDDFSYVEPVIPQGVIEFFPASPRGTKKKAPTHRKTKDKPAS